MPKTTRRAATLAQLMLLLGVSLALTGCGPSRGEVKGTVTYQGKKVKLGTVMFVPKEGSPAHGIIQPDGTYVATKVPAGEELKVIVVSPNPKQDAPRAARKGPDGKAIDDGAEKIDPELAKEWFPIPEIYGEPSTTKLTFTPKSGTNEFPIVLEPQAAK